MLGNNETRPLYKRLKDYLYGEIEKGNLRPNQQIASERELCRRFNLSRTTVRQALAEAIAEGTFYRIQGKGTFVAAPKKVEQQVNAITNFMDTIKSRGWRPGMEVLEHRIISADIEMAKILQVKAGEDIVHLRALGKGDAEPTGLYIIYLPYELGRSIIDEGDEDRRKYGLWIPLLSYHAQKLGLDLAYADQGFEAVVAGLNIAELLQVPEGAPIIKVTSIAYTSKDIPVEFRRVYYRGEKYRFTIRRRYDDGISYGY
ncbi:MAG: GntR family transcriptional regulator [Firmicutes bacterium]|nr:GntR family transcriptional regulator [Bacillota bacterium]